MNVQQIIEEVQDNASEWIEMTENPFEFISGVLANRIVELKNHIHYLQKRLSYVENSHNFK